MPALIVVIPKIFLQPTVALQTVIGREQVHVLVLYVAPEALDKYVVQCPSLAVHAQAYALLWCRGPITELMGGKLASLVSVEDLRRTVFFYGGLQGLSAPF